MNTMGILFLAALCSGSAAATSGFCNVHACGCPPHYKEPWCNPQNARIKEAWCEASSSNCNNHCGIWCGAPTPKPPTPPPPHNVAAYFLLAAGDNICYQTNCTYALGS